MRIAEAIKLLAASFPIQEALLGDIPENTSVPGFDARNNVYRMALLFLDSITAYEGDGGSEGVENWQARTQIPPDLALPTQWLVTGLRMLVDLKKPFLFTRHGLRSADEWRLIRHLAGDVCDQMGWSRELQYPDFKTLWDELANEVLDEDVDRRRWLDKFGDASA